MPIPITGRITLLLRTERQCVEEGLGLFARGERGDRRDDRGVDPADARAADDFDSLPARLERRDEDGERARLVGTARPTAGEDQPDLHEGIACPVGAFDTFGPRAKMWRYSPDRPARAASRLS